MTTPRFGRAIAGSAALRSIPTIASFAVLAIVGVLVVRYQIELLTYHEVGDESETIVVARMLAAGDRLYSEIFNHHGPLTFAPGLIVAALGGTGVAPFRIPIVVLQWGALAALYLSPVLRSWNRRNLMTALAAATFVLYIPQGYGHTDTYQSIAGLFVIAILAQFVLPSIMRRRVTVAGAAIGSALTVSLSFLAVTYAPITVLFLAAAVRRDRLRPVIIGGAAALVANAVFLVVFGSVRGFLVDHLYINLVLLGHYNGQNLGALVQGALAAISENVGMFLILALLVAACVRIGTLDGVRVPWRTALLFLAFVSMLARGSVLQGLPYEYGAIALAAVLVDAIRVRATVVVSIGIAALLVLGVVRLSLLLPGDRAILDAARIPASTPFATVADALTNPDDRVIAYTFNNFQYLAANRLPASGDFFYFPWQQDYTDDPRFGASIDACKDIRHAKPKVMSLDRWTVWGVYPWKDYAGCVERYVDAHYTVVPGTTIYVRNDIPVQRAIDALTAAP